MTTKFWVGGTGTWDSSDTTHWANSSNGAGGQAVPGSSDTVTFDGSSGGGTVTVNFGGLITIQSLTFGAFTGTLDFSVNNNSVTCTAAGAVSGTGTGARTFKMGSGTWTFTNTAAWNFTTTTSLTFDAGTSTIAFTATSSNAQQFLGGGLTYSTVTVAAPSSGIQRFTMTGGNTFATLTFTGGGHRVVPPASATQTITTLSLSGGTSTQPNALHSGTVGTAGTISVASGSVVFAGAPFIADITCTGGATFTATGAYDYGGNTGISSFTAPVAGGVGVIGS